MLPRVGRAYWAIAGKGEDSLCLNIEIVAVVQHKKHPFFLGFKRFRGARKPIITSDPIWFDELGESVKRADGIAWIKLVDMTENKPIANISVKAKDIR